MNGELNDSLFFKMNGELNAFTVFWYLKEISVTFEERFVNIFHSKWNGIFELMKFQVSEKRSCLNPDVCTVCTIFRSGKMANSPNI